MTLACRFSLLCCVLFALGARPAVAQLTESFADGDFTQNPGWQGDVADFSVNAGQQLQTSGAAVAGVKTLVTPSRVSGAATWEFWVNLKFGTSSANLADVFLLSDSARLTGRNTGYFVRLGGTPDEVSLFRKDITGTTLLIDGTDGLLASTTNNLVRVRVTRDAAGSWALGADATGGTAFAPQGTARDTTYHTAQYFGVVARYTASNSQKFYFDDLSITDTTPPTLTGLTVGSATTLRLQLDEPLAVASGTTAGNYAVSGSGPATTAVLDPLDDAAVLLTFGTPFSPGPHTLTVSFMEDRYGNSTSAATVRTFSYNPPAQPGNVRITELFVDPSPAVGLPVAPFVEVLNTSGQTLDLTGWRLQDLAAATAGSAGTLRSSRLAPGQYAILTATADTAAYRTFLGPAARIIGVTSMPTLNQTGDLVRLLAPFPATTVLEEVIYNSTWYRDPVKDDGGWSLEKINPTKPCSDADNWIASTDASGGTPGRQNSVHNTAPDLIAPALVSATLRSPTTVELVFSEAIDTLTATPARFTLTGGLSVTSVDFRPDSLRYVTLTLNAALTPGTLYTLSIRNVADCAGNVHPAALTAPLLIGATAAAGEVRITELFVDPSIPAGNPLTTLPATPFVEIFNTSGKYFDLTGWQLQDATTSVGTLGVGLLAPGQYAVLVRTADTTAYRTFLGATTRIIGVTSMPTLNQTGDLVRLLAPFPATTVLEEVIYNSTWYRDPVKDDGGWSLEKINPTKPCSDANNWIASTDASGGTPGRQNSVHNTAPDLIAPALLSATLHNPTTVELVFSEAIDTLTAIPARFTLTGGLSVTTVDFRPDSLRYVTLTLSAALTPGTLYTLSIRNVADCAGNVPPAALTAPLLIGATAVVGEVRITELFVDPSIPAGNPLTTLPATPFVEIFNTSGKYFDLTGWQLQDATSTGGTLGVGLLAPGQYAVLVRTTDTTAYRTFLGATTRIIGVTGMPTLNQTGDVVKLLTPTGLLLDQVTYDDDWYRDPVKDDGGWSLEKINPTKPCSDADNWIASTDASGGTPGRQNSVHNTAPDLTAPALLSATLRNPTTIELVCSEAIDTLTAIPARFTLTGGLSVTAVNFRPDSLRYVTLTLSGPLLAGTRYTLTGTSVADCAGNTAPFSTTLGLGAFPEPYELLLTEIYADETPSVGLPASEYVEIFNPTNRLLDLTGVTLRKQGSASSAVFAAGATLAPGQYAVVCGSTRGGLFAPFGQVFALTNFPSLNNSGDTLVLRRADGQLLFSAAYSDQWYRDPAKKNGGWSLEMIDPAQPCGLADNWKASDNPVFGGTPGSVNSVSASLPALPAPALAGAFADSPSQLRLVFTQKLDSLTAASAARYAVSGGLTVSRATVSGPELREVRLTLNGNLTPGQTITLTANGLTGCGGATQPLTTPLLIPETPQPGDVVVNEILFNPRPGGVDFVEIVNRSTRQLDLNGYFLANLRADTLYQIRRLAPNGFPLPPGALAVLTTAPDSVVRQYPASSDRSRMLTVASMPTFSDDEGVVVLLDPNSAELDRYAYDERQHTPLLVDEEGVSLERIRLDGPSVASNFHSAASTVGFATPGKTNSQSRTPLEPNGHTLSIEPRVITPGQGGAEFADIAYSVPGAGYTANFTIFDSQGRLTRRLARNQTLGTSGTFQWQGEDDNNRRVPTGYYVLYAEFFDLQGSVKVVKQTVAVGSR